jgi:hypothetical protein
MRAPLRTAFAASLLALTTAASALDTLPEPPADARPGECYGLVYVPPVVREVSEQRLVAAASERSEPVPARYEWVEETVTVPAGKRRKVVKPAVTETVEQTVTVPERTRRIAVPARTRTVRDVVEVPAEGGPVLKPGAQFAGQEGAAFCLVPPTAHRTVDKQVVVEAAHTREEVIPAREKVVKRTTVVEPAVTEWVAVPERTVTRRVKKLVAPASSRTVPVPARYDTVLRREVTAPPRAEWQRVLCETNVTPALVQSLQGALKREGAYQGATHGQFNPQTAAAVRLYQERNGLPTGGLSYATLEKLGVPVSAGQAVSGP